MAFIVTTVNKLKSGAVIFCVLALCALGGAAQAEEPFAVAPVRTPQDLHLLPAGTWHPADADQNEMLLKLSYLRGVLDALQYVQLAPKSSTQALTQLKGLSLGELVSSIDQYYLADPRRREPPIAVLLRMLPQAAAQAAEKPAPEPQAAAPAPATAATPPTVNPLPEAAPASTPAPAPAPAPTPAK